MKSANLIVFTACIAIVTGCANATNTPSSDIKAPSVANATNKSTSNVLFDIARAISIAQAKTGGVAVGLELYADQGAYSAVYEIDTITATHEYQVQIDARTGDVLGINNEYDIHVLPAVKLSLSDAVKIALAQGKGGVQEIELQHKMMGSYYEVSLVGEHPYKLHIDASNGQVLKSHVDYDN